MNNYLFAIEPEIYNYNNIIDYIKELNVTSFMEKLFLTNNICESINSKINYNLPKKNTNNYIFVNSINKFFINQNISEKNNKRIRHDYITWAFLKLIEDTNFNLNLKWITYEEFSYYQKSVIKDRNNNLSEEECNKILKNINDLEEEKSGNNIINND